MNIRVRGGGGLIRIGKLMIIRKGSASDSLGLFFRGPLTCLAPTGLWLSAVVLGILATLNLKCQDDIIAHWV